MGNKRMRYLEIHDRGWHDDYFIVRDELPACIDTTLLPIRHRFWERCRIYGEDGGLWRFEPVEAPTRTFVLWLKAVTLNPRYPLRRSYHRIGEYDSRDLRAKMQERLGALIGELGYTREDEERHDGPEFANDARSDSLVAPANRSSLAGLGCTGRTEPESLGRRAQPLEGRHGHGNGLRRLRGARLGPDLERGPAAVRDGRGGVWTVSPLLEDDPD